MYVPFVYLDHSKVKENKYKYIYATNFVTPQHFLLSQWVWRSFTFKKKVWLRLVNLCIKILLMIFNVDFCPFPLFCQGNRTFSVVYATLILYRRAKAIVQGRKWIIIFLLTINFNWKVGAVLIGDSMFYKKILINIFLHWMLFNNTTYLKKPPQSIPTHWYCTNSNETF